MISADACYVIVRLPSSPKQLWRFSRRLFVRSNFTPSKEWISEYTSWFWLDGQWRRVWAVGKRCSQTFNQVELNFEIYISACDIANCFMYITIAWCMHMMRDRIHTAKSTCLTYTVPRSHFNDHSKLSAWGVMNWKLNQWKISNKRLTITSTGRSSTVLREQFGNVW